MLDKLNEVQKLNDLLKSQTEAVRLKEATQEELVSITC